MSFQTGLSGLNAASQNLGVIGHNIANANTVGMKAGRAEFAEMVASAIGIGGGGETGLGVTVATVSQSFAQGNLTMTGNNLDVAINGGGFFAVEMSDGSQAYTRDGQFKLTKDGEIVTNSGAKLLGFEVGSNNVVPQPLSLPTGAPIQARVTSTITAEFNLDARADLAIASNPPTPITTYGTTLNAYDSQGSEVPVSLYFVKTAADTWDVFDASTVAAGEAAMAQNATIYATNEANRPNYATNAATNLANTATNAANDATNIANAAWNADPANAGDPLYPLPTNLPINLPTNLQTADLPYVASGALFQLQFDTNGLLADPTTPVDLMLTSSNPNIGDFTVQLDMETATQFGTAYAVTNLVQDGYTSGQLTGVEIDNKGIITARYSNGQTEPMGQIALADFGSVQDLGQTNGGYWVETFSSGPPSFGAPGAGKRGLVQSGALEASNVDLTAELVNMITAQRSYQANAQTIKTMDQVLSTLVNLR